MVPFRSFLSLISFAFILCWTHCCFSQTTLNATIEHDGLQRDYILYVPDNYTGASAVPLLFNFHGYTSNANEQMFYGDFRAIADTAGFIIVHPQGTVDNIGNTHFNVGWGSSTVDDIGFANALIDSLAAEYSIDMKRIYSTGMSNGGFMSYLLACQLSDRIAAIASVTGSMSPVTFNACNPQRPVPILEIHGNADAVVPYDGGFIAKSIVDVLDYWVTENNTALIPIIDSLADIDMTDQSTVVHFEYTNGDQGVTIEHYLIIGGGHTWPGNNIGGPGTNYDMNASKEVWRFFSKFDLDGALLSDVDQINQIDEPSVFPNPTNDLLNIRIENNSMDYQLRYEFGKVLDHGEIENKELTLSLSNYSAGLYFLSLNEKVFKIVKVD